MKEGIKSGSTADDFFAVVSPRNSASGYILDSSSSSHGGGGGGGCVFVGQPTSQATGGQFHLSGWFFPTIERELIDFGHPILVFIPHAI